MFSPISFSYSSSFPLSFSHISYTPRSSFTSFCSSLIFLLPPSPFKIFLPRTLSSASSYSCSFPTSSSFYFSLLFVFAPLPLILFLLHSYYFQSTCVPPSCSSFLLQLVFFHLPFLFLFSLRSSFVVGDTLRLGCQSETTQLKRERHIDLLLRATTIRPTPSRK